jgi:hypothetical protein
MVPFKESKNIMVDLQDTTSASALMGPFAWGGVEIDLDAIPRDTFVGLAKQGIIHKLGNEVAAGLVKVKEKDAKEHEGEADYEFDEDAAKVELREAMVKKILDGTIGLRIGGPRGTTIENIAFELAMKEAEAKLAPKGYWPKADRKAGIKAEDAKIDFGGRSMSREDLADMVLEKYKERFLAEAEMEHKARMDKAKAAKANQVKQVSKVDESPEDVLAGLMQ